MLFHRTIKLDRKPDPALESLRTAGEMQKQAVLQFLEAQLVKAQNGLQTARDFDEIKSDRTTRNQLKYWRHVIGGIQWLMCQCDPSYYARKRGR